MRFFRRRADRRLLPSVARAGALTALVAAKLTVASQAEAYCRTVTAPLPANYDPREGCYTPTVDPKDYPSKFLFWKNACVGFSMQKNASTQVTLAEATRVMQTAFDTWSHAGCAGGPASITAVDDGPVACSTVGYAPNDVNQHVIVFRDDVFPYSDPNNTLALTTVTFDKTTGELLDADMEINSAGTAIVTNSPIPPGAYDLATILTHEAGHFLGLAHSADPGAVMYARYKASDSTLSSDDVAGICAIYPSGAERQTSDGPVGAVACNPSPRNGFSSACGDPTKAAAPSGCSLAGGGVGASASNGWWPLGLAALGGAALRLRRRRAGRATLRTVKRTRTTTAVLALLLASGSAGAAAMWSGSARASVSIAILFDELLAQSTGAGIATPLEQTAVWEEGRVYTYTRVRFDRKIAGALDDEGWVRTMGGSVGDIGQLTEGEPSFTVGEPALLFVQPGPAGSLHVTARAQGVFKVETKATKAGTSGPRSEASAARAIAQVLKGEGAGLLLPPGAARVTKVQALYAAGLAVTATPKLASDVLQGRALEDAATEIARGWARTHRAP